MRLVRRGRSPIGRRRTGRWSARSRVPPRLSSNRYSHARANTGCDAVIVAIVGSGISGPRGRLPPLARATRSSVFERDGRAGGHANTVAHAGLALDTGLPRPQRAQLPAAAAALRELGVRDAARPRCRSRSAATAAGSSTRAGGRSRSRGTPPSPRFHALLWEIGRWLRTARRSLDEATTSGTRSAPTSTSAATRGASGALPRPADVGALVDGARPRARLPGRVRDPLLRQPRHARLRPLPLAHGRRAAAAPTSTRARASASAARLRSASACARSGATPDGVELRDRTTASGAASTRSSSRRTPTRRCALLADPSDEERRVLGGFGYTTNETVLHTDSSFLPARRARPAPPGTTALGDDGRPTLTYYLNRLQRLEAETRLLRHAERATIAEEHVIARLRLRPPALHARLAARRSASCRRSRAAPHLLRGRAPRQRLPRGRARVRRARRGRARGGVVRSALYTGTLCTRGGRRRGTSSATRSRTGSSTSTSCPSSSGGCRSSRSTAPNVVSLRDARPLRRRPAAEAGRARLRAATRRSSAC